MEDFLITSRSCAGNLERFTQDERACTVLRCYTPEPPRIFREK